MPLSRTELTLDALSRTRVYTYDTHDNFNYTLPYQVAIEFSGTSCKGGPRLWASFAGMLSRLFLLQEEPDGDRLLLLQEEPVGDRFLLLPEGGRSLPASGVQFLQSRKASFPTLGPVRVSFCASSTWMLLCQ